jgi:hypothetical protein
MNLAPYYPAMMIFAGAVLVALGGLWAAHRQTNFNATLREKNDEIIALQSQQISALTGGDSYPFVTPTFKGDGKVTMLLLNQGKYPLYDVQVTILDGDLIEQKIKKSDNVSRDIGAIYNQSQLQARAGLFTDETRFLQNTGYASDFRTPPVDSPRQIGARA